MDFLAPLMLIGGLGAALPIALHLIGRQRARRVRFAAVDFLLGSDRRLARSLRLRERLLLAARILACLAIAAVLAKPYTACEDHGPVVTRGPQAAVIVVDDSYASGYRVDGERMIDRAKLEARRILAQLGPEAEAAVVTTSPGGRVPSELSRDHIRLRDHINLIEPSARLPDTTTALRRAQRLLEASNHRTRTVYLISPLAAVGLGSEPPWPAAGAPAVTHIDPAGGAPLDNAAVASIELTPDPEAGPRGIRVAAEVVWFGTAPTTREVRLELAGEVVARGTLELRPEHPAVKTFSATLPSGARVADLAIALDADDLPADDRRYALAALRAAIPVLLVDGDPRTVRHDDELFYLGAALRPGDRDDSGAQLTTVTADELADLELERFDVVVLANVAALSVADASRLAAWVEAGGGVFVTVGDHVDPAAYDRTMAALLPQRLATAIDTGFGQAAGERKARALRLAKLELDHPVFASFERDARVLSEAGFRKVMLLGPTTEVARRRVLARFDNDAVALVEAERGAGRLLLFTSSIDRDWNDLPLEPGFLPMMQQAVRHLAKKPASERRRSLTVAEHIMLDVPSGEEVLEVRRPDGEVALFEGDALKDRTQIRFSDTLRPGIYRVRDAGADGRPLERDEAAFVVNLDPRGADLRRADPASLPSGLADGGPERAASHERRVELWHAIAALLLALLLAESALLVRA